MRGMRGPVLAVAVATVLAYARTLSFEFVWDDVLLVARSQRLREWSSLPTVLASHFWAEVHEGSHYYRPLVSLSYFLDLHVWGLNPFGFHLTNLLAHLATALAVLVLARRLTGNLLAASIAGVAFALHPIHTESVTFISGRTDVLSTLLFLLALLGYARWRDGGSAPVLAGSLAAFFLALTAKEVAVTLPLILLLWDLLVTPASGRATADATESRYGPLVRAAGRYGAYGAVIGLYLVVRMLSLGALVESDPGVWGTLLTRLLTTTKIVASYAWMALVPFPANAHYVIVPVVAPPPLAWWGAAAFLAVLLAATAWAVVRAPRWGFCALWFWLTLIPSVGVNLLPLPTAVMAERFLYLPSVGFCILLGLALDRALGAAGKVAADQIRPAPAFALAGLLLAYVGLTIWRNEPWQDHYHLYLNMVDTSPDSDLPHVNLALVQLPRGEIAEAHAHFKRAVEIAPGNPRALVGLGLTETILGEREAGLRHALEAERLAPKNPNVLGFLGQLYLLREEPARAVEVFQESLRLHPEQAYTSVLAARALGRAGRQAEAEAALTRAAALVRPGTEEAAVFDRVTAEVTARIEPARARAALERYIARLKAQPELTRAGQADLMDAERQLAFLGGTGR
jgi:tetratricopeptide (TPR) repeat protein